jgi:hypothetical protein
MILGRPNFMGGDKYNPAILDEIRALLISPNVNFNIINAIIIKKFVK